LFSFSLAAPPRRLFPFTSQFQSFFFPFLSPTEFPFFFSREDFLGNSLQQAPGSGHPLEGCAYSPPDGASKAFSADDGSLLFPPFLPSSVLLLPHYVERRLLSPQRLTFLFSCSDARCRFFRACKLVTLISCSLFIPPPLRDPGSAPFFSLLSRAMARFAAFVPRLL